MGIPYTNYVEVTSTASAAICVTLPAPWRGTLTRLSIKQTSGALGGFAFDLYDRKDACQSESTDTSNPSDAVKLLETELHQLQATQSPAGATSLQFGLEIPYVNRDEQDPYRLKPTDALYLDIDPDGTTVDKDFQIAYTILAPELA